MRNPNRPALMKRVDASFAKHHASSTSNTMTSSASSVSSNSRLLFTVEILDSIISFNSASDATRCARVCRVWLEVSLDHIWADVQGFRPLFGIFAPLQHPEENGEPLDAPLVRIYVIRMNLWMYNFSFLGLLSQHWNRRLEQTCHFFSASAIVHNSPV